VKLRLKLAAFTVIFLGSVAARAQGGPPFLTDDPETPGNKQWEINFGYIGDRNPAAGAYQVPDFDINYGLGDRIQLKFEIPIAIAEERPQPATPTTPAQPGHVFGGLGESYPGVKIRFFEHHPGDPWFARNPPSKAQQGATGEPAVEPVVNFSMSTYPQLALNNPTRAVARGLVENGPDFLLPLEVNARVGPIRFDGEVGYHFGNHALPQSWIRGLLIGHEFTERTEGYAEIYSQQDANRIDGAPKQRQTTLGGGGRQALNKDKTLLLMLMGGRSFQKASADNSQPSWIAYIGLQVLLGPKEPVTPEVRQKCRMNRSPNGQLQRGDWASPP
jgi:hypothetical protein